MSSCKIAIKKVKSVSEATGLVLAWFEQENKPVTPQSLTDALGSRIAKPLVQKILDQLLTDNTLCAKELKKIRFYYLRPKEAGGDEAKRQEEDGTKGANVSQGANEPTGPDAEEQVSGNEKDRGLDEQGDASALHDVARTVCTLAEKQRSLARWRSWPSKRDREVQQEKLEVEIQRLQAEVDQLRRASSASADGSERAGEATDAVSVQCLVRRCWRARQLWVERKACAMRLLEATGGDVHSSQQMAVLLGCTTDVDLGVSFEATAVPLTTQLLRELRAFT